MASELTIKVNADITEFKLLTEETKVLRKVLAEIRDNPENSKSIAEKALERSNTRLKSLSDITYW